MKRTHSNTALSCLAATLAVPLGLGTLLIGGSMNAIAAPPDRLSFDMVVSAGAKNCLPNAHGHVTVNNVGANQRMHVVVNGLPVNTSFTFFVLQVPTAPFAMSWYQGDITTNHEGDGHGRFLGRFNNETFIVAPGSVPAPRPHAVDASTNPTTAPVQCPNS